MKTSYQRLKERHEELKINYGILLEHLRVIIQEPDSEKGMILKLHWDMSFKIAKSCYEGSSKSELKGIIDNESL